MNRFYVKIFFVIILLSGFSQIAASQCTGFARNIARPMLEPFRHDGNFNATYIEEGERAELYKTFFRGEEYRLVVTAVEALPDIRVRVFDENQHLLFDNANHEYTKVWDFVAETTSNIMVQVIVHDLEEESVKGGCLAILFGVKD
ncbi:hypothetical protein QA597_06950 [Marinilabiliaceae bacterium ANBcel2]|nr:hypothetical protein [Marinilabiliaceae bacterium ANBcel2]